MTDLERLLGHADRSGGPDACWEWLRKRNKSGYGRAWDGHKDRLAHRIIYELLVGPIPAGLQIDHLCRNRACVNPSHMETVTAYVNNIRGNSWTALNARVTHCPKGHPYSEENTYRYRGARRCRRCLAVKWRVDRARRNAAALKAAP